jgi:mRNA-degrading endonuclease HigB of HigAB toxin-antitoxin module
VQCTVPVVEDKFIVMNLSGNGGRIFLIVDFSKKKKSQKVEGQRA